MLLLIYLFQLFCSHIYKRATELKQLDEQKHCYKLNVFFYIVNPPWSKGSILDCERLRTSSIPLRGDLLLAAQHRTVVANWVK